MEIIKICDEITNQTTILSGEKKFKTNAKPSYKKKLFSLMQLSYELKYELIQGLDSKNEAVQQCLVLMNELYFSIFDKNNNPRKIIYKKVIKDY